MKYQLLCENFRKCCIKEAEEAGKKTYVLIKDVTIKFKYGGDDYAITFPKGKEIFGGQINKRGDLEANLSVATPEMTYTFKKGTFKEL